MIKELITDLSYEKISLSQALSRAKLIAYDLQNTDFKNWISKEINGYANEKDKLPVYRIIQCDLFGTIENPFIGKRQVPMDASSLNEDFELDYNIYEMKILQSVSTIEKSLTQTENEGAYGYEDFPIKTVKIFQKICNQPDLTAVRRRVQFSQLNHILNLTKHKLIDTLLDLKTAFPNLENDYINSAENNELTKTIINNHIYGANANSTIGIGDNLNQKITIVINQKTEQIFSELKELGVPKENILEIKEIINRESDKANIGKELINWIGKMSTKAVEKGIELKMPLIIEKIQELL
ncbi:MULTISPECIES: hypothetical protein [unclassified Polaribacter]|uniref:AbiTii domain-containing protein n=1 Tax=unclassified Polaribacter TaxID=196858 RepID=UPI0011BEEF9E|nr:MULTISPECIES: hypothetical protein [unclassified Polaribacter]TXD51105.1 hypothetical protein ES043_13325 [Polaribacter sp. IC063]TXD58167.1 hypothetical protein ES044_12935 [Polaribacter sp. IC066]